MLEHGQKWLRLVQVKSFAKPPALVEVVLSADQCSVTAQQSAFVTSSSANCFERNAARVRRSSHLKVLSSPKVCLLMNKKETWDEAHSSREGREGGRDVRAAGSTRELSPCREFSPRQAKKVMNDTGFLQSLKDYDKARRNYSCLRF